MNSADRKCVFLAALLLVVASAGPKVVRADETRCDDHAMYDFDEVSVWCYYGGDNCIGCYVMPKD